MGIVSGSVKDRLKRGAKILGDLWRANERCDHGFGIIGDAEAETGVADCFCEPKNRFCTGRAQWFALAVLKDGRIPMEGNNGMIDMMTGEEWDLAAVTVKFDIPGCGEVPIGPEGVLGRRDLEIISEVPWVLTSVLPLVSFFPKCRIVGIEKPPPVEDVVE